LTDICGGAVLDTEKYTLSHITLRWMIKEAILTNCPIIFKLEELEKLHIPQSIGQIDLSPNEGFSARSEEDDSDEKDAIQKIANELTLGGLLTIGW
jgi:hypothetical protein